MPASPLDSALYRELFGDAEVARLFTDTAEVRAMLLVEGALARAQGDLGLIPADSAAFLHRASLEVQIDPASLAAETGVNGVPVPALVAAVRKVLQAPAHTQWLHWGATSEDIIDTALMLRLRQVISVYEVRLTALIADLGRLAEIHADLPMTARTHARIATPTSFGAVVASWGAPLLRHRQELHNIKAELLIVSLSGASGTNAAMGPKAPQVRAALARTLNLADPGISWHSARDTVAAFAAWITGTAQTLGKLGEDIILLTRSGIEEVRIGTGGGSTTLPRKVNPVAPSVLVALARQMVGLGANMAGAALLHRQQRDATAWLVEWLTLPQMCAGFGRALLTAQGLADTITPDAARMRAALTGGLGLIHAEALSFALAETMPRPEAQAAVKALTAEATATPLDTPPRATFPAPTGPPASRPKRNWVRPRPRRAPSPPPPAPDPSPSPHNALACPHGHRPASARIAMQNRLALAFILITVTLDSIGIGLIFPVMPDLLRAVTGGSLAEAAIWGGVLSTAFAVMQFACGPVVGNLSDRFGRRPVLLVSLAVMAANYLLMAVAGSVWLLLVGRIGAGIAAATQSTASAYAADITPPETRGRTFGLIGAGFGVGFVLGPLVGGLLATAGPRAPFYAAALMATANLAFGALVLPESLAAEHRRPFAWSRANPLAAFRAVGRLPGLGRLLTVFFVYSIAFYVWPAVWSFFGAAAFGWGAWMIGISLALFGACMVLVQAVLIGPAIRIFGESRAALLGMVLDMITFAFYGFVTSAAWALAFTPVSALGGLVTPALQSTMSRSAPPDAQGELQGVLSSLGALSMILSPLLMTTTFSTFTAPGAPLHLPGAPFLLSALLMVVCVALHVAPPRENLRP